jgi:hypothetical protein
VAKIWLAKAPTSSSRARYKIKLSGGPATTIVQSLEPGGSSVLENLEEGFISYLAPVGKGLQFDVGKFVTQHGAEVIEAKDNWNYSRSLLFALAIPYYHSGVRATYAPSDKVSFMGTLVNGWNNVGENNSGKTFGAQIALKPNTSFSIVQNFMAGPEQADNSEDWRRLYDTIATYTVNPKFSLMANYDYGADTDAVSGAGVPAGHRGTRRSGEQVVRDHSAVQFYDDPLMTGTRRRSRGDGDAGAEADGPSCGVSAPGDSDNAVFKARRHVPQDAEPIASVCCIHSPQGPIEPPCGFDVVVP